MEGIITRYEWLDRDFMVLKDGFARQNRADLPRVVECSGLTLRYDRPEGASRYGEYTACACGREFSFATADLGRVSQDEADAAIAEFFRSRPTE